MKKYEVFVDVSYDDWETINVETYIVEAKDAEEANRLASTRAEGDFETYYVWEVLEDDILEEEF